MSKYELVDFQTGASVQTRNLVFAGDLGPWEVKIDISSVKRPIDIDALKKSKPSSRKYLSLMPIKDDTNFVSLGEGATPVVKSLSIGEKLGLDLSFKLEQMNPTGSFKDRGSAVELTIAKELGAKAVVLASTGNMAASCACYASRAGIPCYVIIPESTPETKLAQVIAYGGQVIKVSGNYDKAALIAREVAETNGFYLAGDYAFRVEGQKTAAFEVCDQFGEELPDYIVIPVGCGTNMAAYAKGFKEYMELGLINRIPSLIAVQASGAASVVKAFNSKSYKVIPTDKTSTSASAIAVSNPLDGAKALRALEETNGLAVAVSDKEMLESLIELSTEEGFFIELSSAAALSAVKKLSEKTLKEKKVLCVLTGHGLKDPLAVMNGVSPPPVIGNCSEFRMNKKMQSGV